MSDDVSRTGGVSIGVRGSLGADVIGRLAPRVEALGFRALWVSDSAEGDALSALRRAADGTSVLRLAAGVLPLDRRPAGDLIEAVRDLPADRLTLGVGAGRPVGALARVADGVAVLRSATTAEVAVGALGPKMRRLAAELADVALFNWLSPADAASASDRLRSDAAPRRVRSALYVRTILDRDARGLLADEIARKAERSTYAGVLGAIADDPFAAALDGTRGLRPGIDAYRAAVDETVVRMLVAHDGLPSLESFVEQLAEGLAAPA